MLLVEVLHWRKNDNTNNKKSISLFGVPIPEWFVNSYIAIGTFGFGAACSQLLTDVAKYSIGRLRPHFIDVCKPDIECSRLEKYQNVYIEDFNCEENNVRSIKDAR